MPIPIKLIKDKENSEISSGMDYSFLLNQIKDVSNTSKNSKKQIYASNKDASLLYNIWCKSERNDKKLKINENIVDKRDLMRLKTLGFLNVNNNEVEFTKKGKVIITTMSLAEENSFEKKRQNKSYSEILASMDKRGKKGYRMAFDQSCTIQTFKK